MNVKIIAAVVLIFFAGGGWLYLDCLNRQEQGDAAQMQQGIEQARAEAGRRASAKTVFEEQISAELNSCQAAAEKSMSNYMALMQKAMPGKKNVKFLIPHTVADEAETIMADAKAECQLAYDTRLQKNQ